jgi:hypothetical protein
MLEGLHMASDEVEWYGGDGTNDLKRLRVECFNDKDGVSWMLRPHLYCLIKGLRRHEAKG